MIDGKKQVQQLYVMVSKYFGFAEVQEGQCPVLFSENILLMTGPIYQ